MKIVVASDFHGNLEAFKVFKSYIEDILEQISLVLLGDIIDYGPHSNEVVSEIKELDLPILCNLWGNHEASILNKEYSRFSSKRGVESAKYTGSILSEESKNYLKNKTNLTGKMELEISKKKCLCIHGSLDDEFWGKLNCKSDLDVYSEYDYVFSGHSHIPHFIEHFSESENKKYRNKKKTIFINPGSVGQPRNHNNNLQFVILDIEKESVDFIKLEYDIKKEQSGFTDYVHAFYKERLEVGV